MSEHQKAVRYYELSLEIKENQSIRKRIVEQLIELTKARLHEGGLTRSQIEEAVEESEVGQPIGLTRSQLEEAETDISTALSYDSRNREAQSIKSLIEAVKRKRGYKKDGGYRKGEVTADVSAVVGTWSYTLETPGGELSGTITIEGDQSGLEGTFTGPQGNEQELQPVSFDGTTLSFTVDSPQSGFVPVSVTMEGETFEGSASTSGGSFPITGKRTSTPNYP